MEDAMIHVRFEGKSHDVPLSELDIGQGSGDQEVKGKLARFLDVNAGKLDNYVIEHHENGNMTVRPEAVFG